MKERLEIRRTYYRETSFAHIMKASCLITLMLMAVAYGTSSCTHAQPPSDTPPAVNQQQAEAALLKAVKKRNAQGILEAIQQGANPNGILHGYTTTPAETLLLQDIDSMSEVRAQADCLRVLLQHGANPQFRGDEITLMHQAESISWDMSRAYALLTLAQYGNSALSPETAAWLLEFGAYYGYPDFVDVALRHGADPNRMAIDYFVKEGESVLFRAVSGFECHYDGDRCATAARLLQAPNANPDIRNNGNGLAPLQSECGVEEMAVLLRFGANPNIKDAQGNTVLHRMFKQGLHVHRGLAYIELLARYGFEFSATDAHGRTVLDLCQQHYQADQANPNLATDVKEQGAKVVEKLRGLTD